VDQFNAAKAFDGCAILLLDDVDQLVAGSSSSPSSAGAAGASYSPLLLSTLRALLRQPLGNNMKAQQRDEQDVGATTPGDSSASSSSQQLLVVATTSRRMEACGGVLTALFEEAHVVPLLNGNPAAIARLLEGCGPPGLQAEAIPGCAAKLASATEGSYYATNVPLTPPPLPMGVKAALRFIDRAVAIAGPSASALSQVSALIELLEDVAAGSALTGAQCDV